MSEEKWKDIPGYEGLYQITNFGNARSLKCGKITILKPGKSKTGYLCVVLSDSNKKRKTYYVHRLVWIAFNGQIPIGMQVNHINENKTDNRLDNLNLLSKKDNLNWGTAQERKSQKQKGIPRRKNNHRSKPVLQLSYDGAIIKEYPSIREAERQTKMCKRDIIKCCRKRIQNVGGFIWIYK